MSSNNSLSNSSKSLGNGSKKFVSNNISKVKSGSLALKVMIVLITILVIWALLYWIFTAFKAKDNDSKYSPVIISSTIDGWKTHGPTKLPLPPEGQQLSISTWFYMKNFQYRLGDWKTLLWLGNPPHNGQNGNKDNFSLPKMQFYPFTNAMRIVTSTSAPESLESCDIKNIPFNKWINIIYVLNNRSVDIYIDGKLERSCVLQGLPLFPNNNLLIEFGTKNSNSNREGFFGKIGRTQYFAEAITTSHIRSIYERGPLGSMKYRVNFFTNGDIVEVNKMDGYNN